MQRDANLLDSCRPDCCCLAVGENSVGDVREKSTEKETNISVPAHREVVFRYWLNQPLSNYNDHFPVDLKPNGILFGSELNGK